MGLEPFSRNDGFFSTQRFPMSSTAQQKGHSRPITASGSGTHGVLLDQDAFVRTLRLERKRTERSHRRFVLMLLDACGLFNRGGSRDPVDKVVGTLAHATRETDIKGWYRQDSIIGVIFTEIGASDGMSIANALLTKISNMLCAMLSLEEFNELKLSVHVYPEHSNENGQSGPTDFALYPDLDQANQSKRVSYTIKRCIDIAGSLCALILAAPVFIVIAILIKLTSKGPVLFRQERVGQYGRAFTFLKFRSMYFQNDHTIHQEYVKRLIDGAVSDADLKNGSRAVHNVYKLTDDPRITPLGRFLRRSSLDELPQFLNVLMGSMSLVGPRPPVPYEVECYEMWHKRRLTVKPGITGPWQVGGRSRTTFDEMVRMDLQYSRNWSVWGDIKILSQTPRAVISGAGAF